MTASSNGFGGSACEKLLADAIVGVATELRLAEAGEFVAMIQGGHSANISDLVESSSELFFKSGTLRYARNADYFVRWDAAPVIKLYLEFDHAHVWASFKLSLEARQATVELIELKFDEANLDCRAKKTCFASAIASARISIH